MPLPQHPAIPAYLELMKTCLSGMLHETVYRPIPPPRPGFKGWIQSAAAASLSLFARPFGWKLVQAVPSDPAQRREGRDWPAQAETMIGRHRLDNLQRCIEQVLADNVPGDLIECGVWRGGATIFMRAVLAAYGDPARRVWVADSFAGLPPPNPIQYPADAGDVHHTYSQLAIDLDSVKNNFRRYHLLDERVMFLKGWFSDTLSHAPIQHISVLRADGDMYESTIQILDALYPKLSIGGFCIIDDYGAVPACKQATEDYRGKHGITEPMQAIDWTGAFWRRER